MRKNKISLNLRNMIEQYIKNNIYNYILVILAFLIGILAGILIINNYSNEKKEIICNYVVSFFNKFYSTNDLDQNKLLVYAMLNNFILISILYIAGTTIIGMPIIISVIIYRGFCLSYTISAITLSIGFNKSVLFCIIALFLPNLLFIPAILTIAVSSLKIYKSIIYDNKKDIIKKGLISHLIITIIMYIVLSFASVIESNFSISILRLVEPYIM